MTEISETTTPMTDEEIEKLGRRIKGLRETNAQLTQELAQVGGQVDITTGRIEHALDYLVYVGIMSREQRALEQEAWELRMREALKPMVEQVRQMARAAGQDVQRKSGLILPGAGKNV